MKILERTFFNNGYGCSCHRQDWEETDWIDEEDIIPFETLITEKIKEFDKNANDGGQVGVQYEVDGRFLYGLNCWIYKAGWDFYALFGDDNGEPKYEDDYIEGYSYINKGISAEKIIEKYNDCIKSDFYEDEL